MSDPALAEQLQETARACIRMSHLMNGDAEKLSVTYTKDDLRAMEAAFLKWDDGPGGGRSDVLNCFAAELDALIARGWRKVLP